MGILDAPALRPSGANGATPLMAALREGVQSVGIHVASDSTGAGANNWVRRLGVLLGARFPDYEVQETATWLDGSQVHAFVPATLQAAPLGARYLQCGANTARHPGDGTVLTDIDVQAKVSFTSWMPGTAMTPVSRYYGAGNRGFVTVVNTNGTLSMFWTADGTTAIFGAGSGVIPVVAGTPIWLRWTLKVNNGAGGYTLTYRYSTNDRNSWTAAGTQTGGSTTTLFNPSAANTDYEIGGYNGGAQPLAGRVYELSVADGDTDQSSVVPWHVDHWVPSGAGVTLVGSPRLSIVNGSQAGASLTYLNDTTRCPKMTLKGNHSLAIMMGTSHNDTTSRGPVYLAGWDTWLTRMRTKLPYAGLVVTTQNPRNSPATYVQEHRIRQHDIRMWAAKNGATLIDAYRAFLDDGRGLGVLVQVDGIHPDLTLGAPVWAAKAYQALSAA